MISRLHHTIQSTLVLSTWDVERMTQLLTEHLEQAEAIYAALVDESGTTLAEVQTQPLPSKVEICTLANSALGAVQEMARRLEDDSASVFFHEGNRMSFAVAQVTATASLLTVYGPQARLGLVRAALKRSLPQLGATLEKMASESMDLDLDMSNFNADAFFAFGEMGAEPGPANFTHDQK